MQGVVELRRAGQRDWTAVARLDTPVCQGDTVHAGPRSRAALVILPEKFVRLDQNSTVSISIEGEETLVEFSQDETTPRDACGAGYFITRFPRKFKVRTPFVNAAVEGTEFLVSMSCTATSVAVFEGKVSAETLLANAQRFILNSGEAISVGPGEPPAIKVLIKPVDAVQWTLYYPPLSQPGPGVGQDQQCDQSAPDQKAQCLMARAEQRLRVGRVDEAQTDIDASLRLKPDNSNADALLSIISVAKNDKQRALGLAEQATRLDPVNPRAWIALSYAQQASFKLEEALASAQRAADLQPRSSIALTRVAELMMSLGKIRSALRAAQAAVDANPDDSRAHTILGFAHLADIDTKKAQADFEAAIAFDSSDPIPRLGMGLAIIRLGNLTAGREQIEIGVALDPTNSLLRSYVGKAYYEEDTKERDKLAATQYRLAKQLDPKDPTPWFYDAILKQSQNRPVEALEELQKSISLNDNTAVYRSRLLLDQDQAARAANRARIYTDLGFTQLGIDDGQVALAAEPRSFSAHRFLADAYAAEPRLGFARTSELLQSQMLQPLNSNSVQPQFVESNLLILERAGSIGVTLQELNPLFAQDGTRASVTALGGNNATWGDEVLVSAQKERLMASFGQFHYQTDGVRANDDLTQDIYSLFLQGDVSYSSSFQVELFDSRGDRGDVTLNFNPDQFSTNSRDNVTTQSARVGFRYAFDAGSTLLLSLAYRRRQELLTDQTTIDLPVLPLPLVTNFQGNGDGHATSTELQYLTGSNRLRVVAGVGYYNQPFSNSVDLNVTFSDGTPVNHDFRVDQSQTHQATAYVYSTLSPTNTVSVVAGLSADSFTEGTWFETNQLNPKIGAIWHATPDTDLRAAAFRYLRRSLVAGPSLEPTQVAGFNQVYDDVDGTDSRSYALGADQRFGRTLFAGAEIGARSLTFPVAPVVGSTEGSFEESWRERLGRAYLSWLPSRDLSLSAEYKYELQELADASSTTGVALSSLKTQLIPLTATYHGPTGFFGQVQTTHVSQTVGFFVSGQISPQSDSFWITDASVGYLIPQRRGTVSLTVKNLFNQTFRYQDTNLNGEPRPPLFQPGRSIFGLVSLYFF